MGERKIREILLIVAIIAVIGLIVVCFFRTSSCQRNIVDLRSDFNGGLDRTINVYTADGEIIATYKGKIDLDVNEGGYVKFDFEGKRYIYYNCFVESIGDIK